MGFRRLRNRVSRAVPVRPTALIIGAQKAGTTSLFHYLGQHPRILCSSEKEVDFFGSTPRFGLGEEFYHSHFKYRSIPPDAVAIEASPHYLLSPPAARRIHDYDPRMKLICLLRDPVDRAYSAFNMYQQYLRSDPQFLARYNRRWYSEKEIAELEPRPPQHAEDFEVAVRYEIASMSSGRRHEWHVLPHGLYARNLSRFLEVFPRSQILLADSSHVLRDPPRALSEICEFLGVGEFDWSMADLTPRFVGPPSEPMSNLARNMLREYFAEPNRQLESLIAGSSGF